MKKIFLVLLSILFALMFIFTPFAEIAQPVLAQGAGCVSSSPISGSYIVTLCFTNPIDGSSISGDTPVTENISITDGTSSTQRLVFYLNGEYLLTDFESPYTFILPTTKFIDGSYLLSVEAVMRDGFITERASVTLNFVNGIISPPINQNQFQPSSGIPSTNGDPFIVVAGGDGASGETNANRVTDLIKSLNPNLFLYLGDVYNKGTAVEFYNWYGLSANSFGQFREITNPVVGNHEYENGVAPGYFDYWDNIPSYYSYNAGGWHFIALNSNSDKEPVDPQSTQYQWLQQDLASNAQTCTIVYYHHPLFNIGPQGASQSMADIWNLLALSGVDIVLNGHDHTYQRWFPLDGSGQPDPNGVTEFVAGTSGHGIATFNSSDERVAFSSDANPTAFGALLLQLNQNGANFNFVNTDGTSLDSGVIPCNSANQDIQAPTTPSELIANASNPTQIDLNWLAANDDTGVSGYTIYRDGSVLDTVPSGNLFFIDSSASPNTTYQYSVDAYDAAGNHSVESSLVEVTTPSMPISLTFFPEADTYVYALYPGSNYGTATALRTDSSPDTHSYLRFNVQGLAGTPILRARLLIYANTGNSEGINARAIADNNWDELVMNYDNAPILGNVLAISAPFTGGDWVELDVTPYISGEGTYSLGIDSLSSTGTSLESREGGTNPPQLILDLQNGEPDTQAPTVPSGLTGNASSPTLVDLNWTASTDDVAVDGYTIYRDGSMLTTVPGTSLTYSDASAFPATTYSYTIDAFDQAGNHSIASDPAIVTTPSMPTSLTFFPEADTYVYVLYPGSNYGTATALRTDASPDTHSYLRFNVQGLAGTPILRARLLIYANTSNSEGINARAIADNNWDELVMNYDNAPVLGNVLATSTPFTGGEWVELDVTPYISGEGTYSLGIDSLSPTATRLESREGGTNPPQLILDLQNGEIDTQPPSVPTGLVQFVSGTQVDLSWNEAADNVGVSGYTLYRDGSELVTLTSSDLTYNDSNVLVGNNYSYTIDAFDEAGNHSETSTPVVATIPDTEAPTVPSGLTGNASSPTLVDLNWTASTDNVAVDGYTIYRDGTFLTTVPGTSLTYSDATVSPAATYSYTIDAFDQAGNHSAATDPVMVTTPSMPASLTFFPEADTYVYALYPGSNYGTSTALRTDASPDLHSYLRFNVQGLAGTPILRARLLIYAQTKNNKGISARVVADNNWDELVMNYDNAPNLGNVLATSAPFTGGEWVELDVTPYISGDGLYSLGITSSSNTATRLESREGGTNPPQLILDLQNGEIDTQPPSVPTGLAQFVTGTQVDLSWNEAADNVGVIGYTLYRDGSELVTLTSSDLTYNDSNVQVGNNYSYTIDAFDEAGNHSETSTPVMATIPDTEAPTVPSGLTGNASSPTLVDLNWTASTDNVAVDGYTIYRDGSMLTTVTGASLTYSDATVSPATTYSYTIDAFDQAGNHSAATDPVMVTTPDPAPTVPTGLTAFIINSTQIDLEWTASTDNLAVAGYTVYRNDVLLSTVSDGSLTYSDTTVQAGINYNYSVDAFDEAGNHSETSTPVMATIPDTEAPTVPSGLTGNASSPTLVDLNWTASTDNVAVDGYTIYRDGTLLSTVTGASLTYSDATVSPATTYSYTIDAFDQAGNHSAATDPVMVTTDNLPSSLTYSPEADTYVNANNPGSNYGTSTVLRTDASPDLHSYLRFNVQGLYGRSILRVRLLIYAQTKNNKGISAQAVADNNWDELFMNYDNAPILGNVLASSASFKDGDWIELDITPYISGEGIYSLGITSSSNTATRLESREGGINPARLIIDLQ